MISRLVLVIIFICACNNTQAQINLVRNSSMEQHSGCPSTFDQISLANYWSSLDSVYQPDSLASYGECAPEYCNVCATFDAFGVPSGAWYYQYPRTGNGMAQVEIFCDQNITLTYNDYRDYLQGRLYHHLIAGQSYCVTYYANLEEGSGYSTNNIDAYLDDGTIDTFGYHCGMPHTEINPQIIDTAIIYDTLNWIKIQGSFVANGTERFITIGDFHDKAHTSYVPVAWPFGAGGHLGMYLIDDISVIASDATANAGPDVSIARGDTAWIGVDTTYGGIHSGDGMPCYWYVLGGTTPIDSGGRIQVHPTDSTTYVVSMDLCGTVTYDTVRVNVSTEGVKPLTPEGGLSLYPNPAGSELTISAGYKITSVVITNLIGQVLSTHQYNVSKISVDVSVLPPGVYFVKVNDMTVRKFVKE